MLLSSRAGCLRRRINSRSEKTEVLELRASNDEAALVSSGAAGADDSAAELRVCAAVSLSRSGADCGTPFACAPPDRNDCSCRTEPVSSAGDDSSFGFEGATLAGLRDAGGGAALRALGSILPMMLFCSSGLAGDRSCFDRDDAFCCLPCAPDAPGFFTSDSSAGAPVAAESDLSASVCF